MTDPLHVDLDAPALKFAAPQPAPAPPDTDKGRSEAAAQMRQAWNDSYTNSGEAPVDGTQPDRDGRFL